MVRLIFIYIIRNWKTGLSGVLLLSFAGLRIGEYITADQMILIITTLVSAGLIAARDASRKDKS